MSPIPAVNSPLLASISRLLLPDLVVTEFIEMRLVEVNGAGWCLQLVSNRRGPGHLIICLLIARRRTNRSCREEARAEDTAQRSHARQEQQQASVLWAGGVQGEGCSGRCRARLCTLAPPGDPLRSCSRLHPAPSLRPTPPAPCSRARRELLLG